MTCTARDDAGRAPGVPPVLTWPVLTWRLLVPPAAMFLVACADETITGHSDPGTVWRLEELDGTAFPARATVTFPSRGAIAGTAPCNSYSGVVDALYPWFDVGTLAVTRRTCPDMAAERAFFAALEAATLAEASGGVLILSNEAGRELVFRAE